MCESINELTRLRINELIPFGAHEEHKLVVKVGILHHAAEEVGSGTVGEDWNHDPGVASR